VRLFHRLNRRIALTDTGRNYLQSLASVFDRIESATNYVIHGGVSDVITVHCPPSFAPAWLVPRIPDFMRTHPDIDLRLHATPEPPDFFRSDTDVEIRYGPGDWPGLHTTTLMSDYVTPLASPSLRKRLSRIPHPEELRELTLIHSERSPVRWVDWFKAMGADPPTMRRGLRFDRGYLSIQAACNGLGVALESLVFAEREIEAGDLVPLFGVSGAYLAVGGHHLVYPPGYGEIPKIQRFRDWIVAAAQDTQRVMSKAVPQLPRPAEAEKPSGRRLRAG
jgi:LysR family glycine cleavage system transcriptional activator